MSNAIGTKMASTKTKRSVMKVNGSANDTPSLEPINPLLQSSTNNQGMNGIQGERLSPKFISARAT